jgi:hypothetical protein
MIAPADPRSGDHLDGLVEYRLDVDAVPGNAVPALARLLIDLARQRRDASREQQHGGPSDEA